MNADSGLDRKQSKPHAMAQRRQYRLQDTHPFRAKTATTSKWKYQQWLIVAKGVRDLFGLRIHMQVFLHD